MSRSTTQTIYSRGIYHGLPDFSQAPKGMTAIVTGANGISGAHMVFVFSPQANGINDLIFEGQSAFRKPRKMEQVRISIFNTPLTVWLTILPFCL